MTNWFHHPDFSLPVVRRRVTEQLVDFLACGTEAVLSRGRSLVLANERTWTPSERNALYRLRRDGLIIFRHPADGVPGLRMTAQGERRLGIIHRPERRWRHRWKGLWYVVSYDIPERHRNYRKQLRTFLRRLRLGYLHDSVWITPFDIRPEFDDLLRGANVGAFAHLFEARTVLGLPAAALVREAWDFDVLVRRQGWYLKRGEAMLDRLSKGALPQAERFAAAREETEVYRAIMSFDPLLPEPLWPADYRGPAVVARHRELQLRLRA